MPNYYESDTDDKTLIGQMTCPEYSSQQEQQNIYAILKDYEGPDNTEDQQPFEALAWVGAVNNNGVLVKKACEHSSCSHFHCDRGLRLDGIEI